MTELERINTELEWFMELNDALSDGRTEDAADSVRQAIRELRRLRKVELDGRPIDTGADGEIDLSRIQFAETWSKVSEPERRSLANARLATALQRYLRSKAASLDSCKDKSTEPTS